MIVEEKLVQNNCTKLNTDVSVYVECDSMERFPINPIATPWKYNSLATAHRHR